MTKHQKGLLLASTPFIFLAVLITTMIVWGPVASFFVLGGTLVIALLTLISVGLYIDYMRD